MFLISIFLRKVLLFILLVSLLLYVLHKLLEYEGLWSDVERRCSVPSIEEIDEFSLMNRYRNKVPKLAHYLHKGHRIPKMYEPLIKGCLNLNQDVMFLFWSEKVASQLMLKHFSNKTRLFQRNLRKKSDRFKRSHFIRYFLLLKLGGIYLDLDTNCKKTFQVSMGNSSCMLSREPQVHAQILWDMKEAPSNSLMACIPDHDFFKEAVNSMVLTDTFLPTNEPYPPLLTKLLTSYAERTTGAQSNLRLHRITLESTSKYASVLEATLERRCQSARGQWRKIGCQDLADAKRENVRDIAKAVSVHQLLHLRDPKHSDSTLNMQDLCQADMSMAIPSETSIEGGPR